METDTIRDAIARSLWLSAYADAIDNAIGNGEESARDFRAGPGEDWNNVVPIGFPKEARDKADAILATMRGKLADNFAPCVSTWRNETGRDDDRLGHCIALQSLGHGVGIGDDLPAAETIDAMHRMYLRALDAAIPHVDFCAFYSDGKVTVD